MYALIAMAIVAGAIAAGTVLVTALVIIPAVTARLVTRTVRQQMLVAGALGCVAGWSGLYASYYWRLASVGAVVMAATALFLPGLLVSSLGRSVTRSRQARRIAARLPLAAVLDPPRYAFMRNGLLEVLLLGTVCGLVGPFVVQRKLTFFGHALSRTIFLALVLAAVLRISALLAAALGVAPTVGLVFHWQRRRDVGQDSAVGTILVGLFALGVVLVGWFRVRSADVGAAVIGNLLGIGTDDPLVSAALVAVLGVTLGTLYRPLVLVAFDRLGAQALALPVALVDLTLLATIAATAVLSVKAVGVILTVAMLVTPAAAARLWSAHLPRIMVLTGFFGALAGTLGLYAAYYVPIAPAAVVVVTLGALFLVSVLIAPRGPVWPSLQVARRTQAAYPRRAWRRLDWT